MEALFGTLQKEEWLTAMERMKVALDFEEKQLVSIVAACACHIEQNGFVDFLTNMKADLALSTKELVKVVGAYSAGTLSYH